MINTAVQYRKSVKALLQCSRKVKEQILSDFDRLLASYLDECPDPAMEELVAAFGPPEAVASELMHQLTSQELTQHRRNRLILRILTWVFATFLAVITVYIWFFKDVGLTSIDHSGIDECITTDEVYEDNSQQE